MPHTCTVCAHPDRHVQARQAGSPLAGSAATRATLPRSASGPKGLLLRYPPGPKDRTLPEPDGVPPVDIIIPAGRKRELGLDLVGVL